MLRILIKGWFWLFGSTDINVVWCGTFCLLVSHCTFIIHIIWMLNWMKETVNVGMTLKLMKKYVIKYRIKNNRNSSVRK